MYPRAITAYTIPRGTFYAAAIISNRIDSKVPIMRRNWFHMPSNISYKVKGDSTIQEQRSECNLINVQVNGFYKVWMNAFFTHKMVAQSKDFRIFFPPPHETAQGRGVNLARAEKPLPATADLL